MSSFLYGSLVFSDTENEIKANVDKCQQKSLDQKQIKTNETVERSDCEKLLGTLSDKTMCDKIFIG